MKRSAHDIYDDDSVYEISVADLCNYPKELKEAWRALRPQLIEGPMERTGLGASEWRHKIHVQFELVQNELEEYIKHHFKTDKTMLHLLEYHANTRLFTIEYYCDYVYHTCRAEELQSQHRDAKQWLREAEHALQLRKMSLRKQKEIKIKIISLVL